LVADDRETELAELGQKPKAPVWQTVEHVDAASGSEHRRPAREQLMAAENTGAVARDHEPNCTFATSDFSTGRAR
jgi:hypothetical protein